MNWITLKLMQYQLKKALRQQHSHTNTIVKQAYENLIKSYETTIMYLKANK